MKRSLGLVVFGAVVACGGASSPPVAPVTADPSSASASPTNAPPPVTAPPPASAPPLAPSASAPPQVTDAQAAELARQADSMQIAILGSSSTQTAPPISRNDIPPVDLSGASATGGRVDHGKPTGPKGDVQLGGTSATVPIANGDRVVAGLRPRFRQCYQQGLNVDPMMSGKIVLRARVAPNGEVSSADVMSNTGMSPVVAACVARVLKQPQFEPPGGGGSTLNVPITFLQKN